MSHLIPEFATHNANFSACCANGGTALHWAATYGFDRTIDLLIQAGMSILDTDNDNVVPPLWAFREDDRSVGSSHDFAAEVIMHLIVVHGSPVNHLDNNRQDILHLAAAHARHRVVAFLLITKRMNPNLQGVNGMTPLHLATINHAGELTMQILKTEPDLTIRNKLGQTALNVAIRRRI